MRSFKSKLYFLIGFFFCFAFVYPQNEKTLDSLENRLNILRNKNPDETIKIGTYILKNSTSDKQKSNTLALMSFAYFAKENTKKSTELLFQAKEYAEKTNDPEIITKIYGTIAQMYLNIDFKDKAVYYLHLTIDEIKKLPEGNDKYRLKGLSYIELGKINMDDKKYGAANSYFKNSLSEFSKMKIDAPYYIKRSYYNLGDSFYYLKKLDSASFYIEKTLEIKENPTVNDYAVFTLSDIYTAEKKHQLAIDTLKSILKNKELNDDILKSKIYLSISKNYKMLEDYKNFDLYNEKHLEINKEIAKHNIATIKNAVNLEEKKLTNEISSANKQNTTLIIILFLISAISIVVFLYIGKKRQKQKRQYEAIIRALEKKSDLNNNFKIEDAPKGAESQLIPSEVEQEILEKLNKFEKSDRFTNQKLNISTLAVQLKTNTTYLSQIINKYKGKNFNTYINELRINYICEKIHNNPEYLNYKISYLGEISGFATHSAFAKVFKSVTGISPSIFLTESARKNQTKYNLNN
ncbi:AraC family transcriptional regulator [Chryseobacterium sp. KACC 21268]|nr:AraC family transcriptional regulator [Chryseobacterium sp. KACC 21268]